MEKFGERPLVSIIIPTYNSQETIERCLRSIKDQTYKEIEPIVVDRHSEDKTTQIVQQFKTKLLFVTRERSTSKNYAAKRAHGEFLLFIDSDMTLAPMAVEECISKYKETNADAITIPLKSISKGILGECRKTERESLSSLREFMEVPRFFRKTAFLTTGGFDENLVCGEDFDLSQRFKKMGYKIDKINSEVVHFEGNPSLYDVLSKAYYYGTTLPELVKKRPQETVKRYAAIRLTSLKITGAMFKDITLLLSFAMMKTFEFIGYFAGIFAQLSHQFLERCGIKMLKNKLLTNKLAIINFAVLTLISLLIFRNFLFSAGWPAGGDVLGFVSRAYLYGKDFRWLYIWRQHSFGFVEGINFMDFFMMLTYLVLRNPSWTVKIFMFLSYLAAAFFMYLFAYRYTHKHVAALSASLIYILNQWLFSQLTEAHVDILFSYALAPLVFLLFDNALKTGKFKDIIFSSLSLGLFITGFHPECIVIYGVFILIFALFFLFFPSKTENFKTRFYRLLKVSVPSILLVFLLSAFFLIPFLSNVRSPYLASSYMYPLEDSFASSYSNLTDAFTLRAVEKWGYVGFVDVYSGLGLQDFPLYPFLFLMFLLAYCTLLIRRDRYTFFFAFSTLISVFIAKGPNPPFGQIFIWAWFNIPHFAVFRAASRWIVMAIFSHAFFTSLLVFYLTNYIEGKTSSQGYEKYFEVKVKIDRFSKIKKFAVSIKALNVFLKKFRKFLYMLGVILLIFVFLSGFLSSTFFLFQGLQVYTPPVQYLAPYEWLASQCGDYKVVSVSRSPSEWVNPSGDSSDFAFSGMLTDLGWTHDIGFDSSFIHDMPMFQDGGWDSKAREFVEYLRFRLVRGCLTDNLFKILGPFAYNYIVIPSYTVNNTREFFLNQKGYHVVYNQTALVLQNDYAASRIFATNNSMLVLGGLESFNALSKIESFKLNETAMFFVPQTIEDASFLDRMFNESQMFCFVNTDILDLAMISLGKKAHIIFAGNYGASSLNLTEYWVKCASWRTIGAFTLSGNTLSTLGKNKIDLPFELSSSGIHDVWLRIGFAPTRGKLSISVDGEFVKEICPNFPLMSEQTWVNITRLSMTRGKHVITLENDGTDYNDVDALAIVNPSELESQIDEILNRLQNFQGRVLYLLDAADHFLDTFSNYWHWIVIPYNGYIIRSEGLGLNVSPLATVNATSISDSLEAEYAVDGDLSSRWASEKYVLPQWLELTWDKPQKIRGVQIVFENAYATDYLIHTWNGTRWINQTTVTGNSVLEKVHTFAEPVETEKLRIYVTKSSIYDRVSIRELEAYTLDTTSAQAKITIPRKGNYTLAARVATGPDHGTLYFKINDTLYPIQCNNSIGEFEWREIGPFSFDVGEQYISVGGVGLVELDEILIYSLRDGEEHLPLDELFNIPIPEVSVDYKRRNSCLYEVYVNASEPFTLIFSESYNPLWKAVVDDEEFSSTLAYSLVNSFYINKTGQFKITIYFTGQSYADAGLRISLATVTAAVVVVLVPYKVFAKLRCLKPKLSRRKS